MGALTSRQANGNEDIDTACNNVYRYPPKSGNYFGSHFIMGGERFDMSQPEAYLFGENQDLNFLGSKPVAYPYPSSSGNEPTKTLKSLVNIRKDSLRFVKVDEAEVEDDQKTTNRYNVEFVFDSDVKCAITIYYFATEEFNNGQLVINSKYPIKSDTYHYKKGANQLFSQTGHVIEPTNYTEEEWQYDPAKDIIPVVIHCVVEDEEHPNHAHLTFGMVEKSSADSGYILKPLKQKQFVDGLSYLLQEIYGIENKQVDRSKLDPDDEVDDSVVLNVQTLQVDSGKDSVVTANMKLDDKKLLGNEELKGGKETVEVVKTKDKLKPHVPKIFSEDPDSTDESKVVNVSNDYSSDTLESKGTPDVTKLRVYDLNESEADSDYDMKTHPITGTRCSTEDLADDEREDTSEAEQEPEPDYDDEPLGKKTEKDADSDGYIPTDCYPVGSTPEEKPVNRITYVKGLSKSEGAVNKDNLGYEPMKVSSELSLPGTGSSTEGSSFSSNHSSGALLPAGTVSDDDKS
ncbi:E3 ubiquitin-protein ligase MGRN1,Probable E3 ubiquitin-protein ligase MGRN1,E3 ubiquitin ligase RNF157,E3 ubiquitin ligase Rnf157 [Mytilus edulis]|uniref:RING-type E3 ubiquitin transferase n=1 Tax=Mytilus edulis TaxID=6550 RepID=A0A8S3QKB5_MYTED|nr:E3 ubiquitin-protein ligase MGRN1,Probable E3 ubiquitin-protein ligase MGRN1,E3 ubiquitin ligase RNF157,E3 ubiquitin ligase Rnf157 [Mytilus edulis]